MTQILLFESKIICPGINVFRCALCHWCIVYTPFILKRGLSWSWSYGSWIYNYLCYQCLSPLKLWVRNPFMARCTTRCNVMWYSLSVTCDRSVVFSTNKSDCHELLLKVALNTLNHKPPTKLREKSLVWMYYTHTHFKQSYSKCDSWIVQIISIFYLL